MGVSLSDSPSHYGYDVRGLWSAVIGQAEAEDTDQTERALALVETLLDRYGVIAQPVIDKENIPGGYSALYPVIESHGGAWSTGTRHVRPWFWRGPLAERDTVDALRHPSEHRGQSVVALSVLDPQISVAPPSWPDAPAGAGKPARRIGSHGRAQCARRATIRGRQAKHLTAFDQSVGP